MNLLWTIKSVLTRPAFVIAAVVLLVAAVSLNAAVEFMQLHFRKERVELRKPLAELPRRLGPWVQVSTDAPIDHEVEQVLQTNQYIFRDYVDTRRVPQDVLAAFDNKTISEQRGLAAALQAKDPAAVINVAVTYYTGMVDTVSHIPDRCYIADGYEPTNYETPKWSALQHKTPDSDNYARFINFEDRTPSRKAVTKNVAYFFHSNGDYVGDPLGVRTRLQNLLEEHGYYAKVELMMLSNDRQTCAQVMNDFLTNALPELEHCLPDWAAVKAAARVKGTRATPAAAAK
jgi:hypothetical protein